jgi:N-acetyl-anhydromuramyl-L-alanine amidase AmpD
MNLESKYKTELVFECRKLGAYARRLEDRYAIGLLDLTIKFPGYPHILAEGKIVAHQSFAPTLRQYEEGRRYIDAGGLCCLIGWDRATKAMFIHPWAKAANKANSFTPASGSSKAHAQTLLEWLQWQTTK